MNDTRSDRYDVLTPHNYVVGDEPRTDWTRLRHAFPNRNSGFTLKLHAIPVAVDGAVSLVLKKRKPKDTAE